MNHSGASTRQRPRWLSIVTVIIGLPILYVLTIPPMVWYWNHHGSAHTTADLEIVAIDIYFAPVYAIHWASPPAVGRVIDAYGQSLGD